MRRRLAPALCCAIFAACHAAPPPQSPAPSDTLTAREPPASDTLGLLRYRVDRALAPVRAWRVSTERTLRADSATARADSSFIRLRSALQQTVAQLEPELDRLGLHDMIVVNAEDWPNEARRQRAEKRADTLKAHLAAHGVWARASEGMVTFEPADSTLLSWLGRFLPASTKEFLLSAARAQRTPVADDAALTITYDELENRLLSAEEFLEIYATSAARIEMLRTYTQLLAIYFAGIDNSPIFDSETRRLLPALQKRFEQFAQKHAATRSGKLAVEYLRVLRSNRYLRTAAVEEFHRKLWDAIPD